MKAVALNLAFANLKPRLKVYKALTKLNLSLMTAFSAVIGYLLADPTQIDWLVMLWAFLGSLLAAGGSQTLNQCLEVKQDSLMRRTQNRPLPSQQISLLHASLVGCGLAASGLWLLFVKLGLDSGFLTLIILVGYLGIYTPLKQKTVWNTWVGSLFGALPPLVGWVANSPLDERGWVLFNILFFWQMPHFLSLAWKYREDYARGAYKMLTVSDPSGKKTSIHIIIHGLFLLETSLLPFFLNQVSYIYLIIAALLGGWFLWPMWQFYRERSVKKAMHIFLASNLYLPFLLIALTTDAILL